MSAIVGRSLETNHLITIGEKERCGGLYVLGQPRTGKSTLLVSLALSDIEKGYGVVFIDPHMDAINDLAARIPSSRQDDIILLDPTHKSSCFGINLLHCADPSDPLELDKTYGRVRDIFLKIWGDQNGQLGVWLDKILRNSVYLLLENPGYTLVEVPLLLTDDTRFRNSLLQNVRINPYIKDFWYDEFDRLSKREKTDQVGPALSRLDIFRTNSMVRNIVGQKHSTIDFYEILNNTNTQNIVLLRMPTQLSSDVKTLIGTMFVSEMVNAVFARDHIPVRDRRFFGLFCDEFHDFVTPDFAKLFTQTGKYRVMPVVAHHERLGQFKPGDPNQGATLAAPNKVFFTLSVHDAGELALEFTEEPPVEIKREQELVISQNPVAELLARSHRNPEIRAFVAKYLRHTRERREDTKAQMEGERLKRMEYLDDAGIYAVDERLESRYDLDLRRGILDKRAYALAKAKFQTRVLKNLFDLSEGLRLTERGLNTFLSAVMEGRIASGQEQFSDFLISLVQGFAGVESASAEALKLYIALAYGDPTRERIIPFGLAGAHGLYSQERALLTCQAEQKTRDERQKFEERYMKEKEEWTSYWRRDQKRDERKRELDRKSWVMEGKQTRLGQIRGGQTQGIIDQNRMWGCDENYIWHPPIVYSRYIWLARFSEVFKILAPSHRARYGEGWSLMPGQNAKEAIAKMEETLVTLEVWKFGGRAYMKYWKPRTVSDLITFLRKFGESGFLMLALLDCAANSCWGSKGLSGHDMTEEEFPLIEGKDAIEVWCLIEALRRFMHETLKRAWFTSVFAKQFNRPYFDTEKDEEELKNAGFCTTVSKEASYERIKHRADVKVIESLLTEEWRWFSGRYRREADGWNRLVESKRSYLLCRAADRIAYGEGYRSLPASANPLYEEVVNGLVALSQRRQTSVEDEAEKKAAARELEKIKRRCGEEVGNISYSPPALLESRVLSGYEIEDLKRACVEELGHASQETRSVAGTIDEFVQFCALLARPENHIQVPCGQYIQREVRARQEVDMSNEVARKLTELPKYTAYAKIMKEIQGEHIVWKGKIQTLQLNEEVAEEEAKAKRAAIEQNSMQYLKSRVLIEGEIRERQERWRSRIVEGPGRTESAIVNGRPASSEADDKSVDEPPPPTQSPPEGESDEPPPIHS